jgi:cytochrome P450
MSEGTLINPIAIGNHFNSTYFKNPYEWNPERWLN